MDLLHAWKRVQEALGASPASTPTFEAATSNFLTSAKPIQAAPSLYIYVDAIAEVHTPLELQLPFRFHVNATPDEPVSKPEFGVEALAYGDRFDSDAKQRSYARPARAFWFTFTSRKSLKENQNDLFEFVRERCAVEQQQASNVLRRNYSR